MSRNGSGVYTLPPGSTVSNGDLSDATDVNTPFSDLETDMNTPRPIVAGGTGASSASAARTALGVAVGSDVQAFDTGLASIAGLTTAANKMIYTTASDVYAVADLTAAGRALLDDADAAAQLVTLGAQPAGATLTSLEALALVAGDTIYATAADTLARLAKGTAAQVLRMNSGATAPEWATSGAPVLLASKTASASATLDFTEFVNATYSRYRFVLKNVKPATDAVDLRVRFSTDAGATYDATAGDYQRNATGRSPTGGGSDGTASAIAIAITAFGAGSDAVVGNGASEFGVSGEVTLNGAGNAAVFTTVQGDLTFDNSDGNNAAVNSTGRRNLAQDTTGLRFLFSSGNIASGTIEMWGLI